MKQTNERGYNMKQYRIGFEVKETGKFFFTAVWGAFADDAKALFLSYWSETHNNLTPIILSIAEVIE
jgi:hypothetical protein